MFWVPGRLGAKFGNFELGERGAHVCYRCERQILGPVLVVCTKDQAAHGFPKFLVVGVALFGGCELFSGFPCNLFTFL